MPDVILKKSLDDIDDSNVTSLGSKISNIDRNDCDNRIGDIRDGPVVIERK